MTAPDQKLLLCRKKFLPCGRHPSMHRCEKNILEQNRAFRCKTEQFGNASNCSDWLYWKVVFRPYVHVHGDE